MVATTVSGRVDHRHVYRRYMPSWRRRRGWVQVATKLFGPVPTGMVATTRFVVSITDTVLLPSLAT